MRFIDNDNPPEWDDNTELTEAFMAVSDIYDTRLNYCIFFQIIEIECLHGFKLLLFRKNEFTMVFIMALASMQEVFKFSLLTLYLPLFVLEIVLFTYKSHDIFMYDAVSF